MMMMGLSLIFILVVTNKQFVIYNYNKLKACLQQYIIIIIKHVLMKTMIKIIIIKHFFSPSSYSSFVIFIYIYIYYILIYNDNIVVGKYEYLPYFFLLFIIYTTKLSSWLMIFLYTYFLLLLQYNNIIINY